MHTLQYYYDNGKIPLDFKGIIPEVCTCGWMFVLNEDMTQMKCSNPVCPYHMSMKMNAMLKQLNVRDIGPSTCETMILENQLVHHTQVFELSVDDMPSKNQQRIKEKFHSEIHKVVDLSLADIAKLLRAPDMQTRCDDIFKGYDDIDAFYKDFNYSEDFISQRVGISKGILTARFRDNLTRYEAILRGLCKMFVIPKTASVSLVICMTGDVLSVTQDDGSSYRSREVFLREMQRLSAGFLTITSKSQMSNKVHYLVTDTPNSGTSKNRRADELGVTKLTFKDFKHMLTQYVSTKEETNGRQ